LPEQRVHCWPSYVARAAHYLVLDACRNTLQGARGGKGFVPVGQQSGVLVAFATEPGKTASDIGQNSGLFAAVLATDAFNPRGKLYLVGRIGTASWRPASLHRRGG